jgi:hypothetical protein
MAIEKAQIAALNITSKICIGQHIAPAKELGTLFAYPLVHFSISCTSLGTSPTCWCAREAESGARDFHTFTC